MTQQWQECTGDSLVKSLTSGLESVAAQDESASYSSLLKTVPVSAGTLTGDEGAAEDVCDACE